MLSPSFSEKNMKTEFFVCFENFFGLKTFQFGIYLPSFM